MRNDLATYQQYQVQPAMAGFFSWLRKAVNTVATALTGIVPFAGALADFTDGDGQWFNIPFGSLMDNSSGFRQEQLMETSVDYDLSPSEEAVLDFWVENNFLPILKPYLLTLKGYIANPPSIETFNAFYNEMQEFIAVLKWYQGYVLSTGERRYTDNALKSRNQFMNVQIAQLQSQLQLYIESTNAYIQTEAINVSVSKAKYRGLAFVTPEVFNVNTYIVSSIQTIDDTDVVISDAPIDTTMTAQTKSYKWVLWLLAAGVVYKLTTKKNKN